MTFGEWAQLSTLQGCNPPCEARRVGDARWSGSPRARIDYPSSIDNSVRSGLSVRGGWIGTRLHRDLGLGSNSLSFLEDYRDSVGVDFCPHCSETPGPGG